MLQRDLRRVLGVAGATVSRMLKSLEELGLVERKPASDRRCRVVTLTSAGTDALANVDAWIDKDWGSQETVTSPNLRIEGPHGRWYDLFYCGYATGFARRTEPAWLLYAQFFSPYGLWHPQD
jgi:DNA-binding MarR family transcriptional regulator